MSYPVTYYCPHCETLVAVDREGYLDDKAVTPYPLEGWTYVAPSVAFGDDGSDEGETTADEGETTAEERKTTAEERKTRDRRTSPDPDGVRFVCGESDGVTWAPDTGGTTSENVDDGADAPTADAPTADETETDDVGCGEPFYLSFVRFEDGREVDPRTDTDAERIRLNLGREPDRPRGPGGPSGPDGGSGGFWG
ncbi:hypothetical protein SAMN05192561_102354 [Halopenitus malekzadehii]|uniref:DUF7969 domain-containing protein n=1 Tax=Halopenitus malekzadehii TaxID=1267564 RepID=A0A1H6IGH4_9EURY|nr:hypothetical protein [Halopenitus malekzadehii]SEH48012.1 hypothetical protein SAMN05192561_102354 [Halopenitus malekzadehii]